MHFSFVRLVPYQYITTNLGLFTHIHIHAHTQHQPAICFPLLFQVAVWSERLFPSVSYPSSRQGGVLGSIPKKTKNLFAEHADLKCILQKHADLDFVSPLLMKFELKRGHLLEEETEQLP